MSAGSEQRDRVKRLIPGDLRVTSIQANAGSLGLHGLEVACVVRFSDRMSGLFTF